MSDVSETKKVFLSYIDDNDVVINGYVDLIEITDSFIVINTYNNKLTIPIHRVLKIKENLKEGEE